MHPIASHAQHADLPREPARRRFASIHGTGCKLAFAFAMASPGFVGNFTGLKRNSILRQRITTKCAPRCAMGDSVAPVIRITDTKSDQSSNVQVQWASIPPNDAEAVAVTSNMALNVALRSKPNVPASTPSERTAPPPGVSPTDFYFPKAYRNKAPCISLVYNESIAVANQEINPVVGGIAANSVEKESVAFWKAKTYKYSAPDTASSTGDYETVSTALFEKHFPSSRRNMAPYISIKAPAGDWDQTAYVQLESSYVQLNPAMAAGLDIPTEAKDPDARASATVEKYFGKDPSYAPKIEIKANESVSFGLEAVPLPMEEAERILSATA